MKVISILEDRKIRSKNILVEFAMQEYLNLADKLLTNNPFQRKRVKSSSTVYSLLRNDLKAGCVIPPLVLAMSNNYFSTLDIDALVKNEDDFFKFLSKHINEIILLDGLQRTYNILDAAYEIKQGLNEFDNFRFYNNRVRCEIYIGIDKIGILYRMLTLNTGQTPMSLRHQIEILYSNFLDNPIPGIKLLREIDESKPQYIGEYSFKDVIEGFTSYLMRDYLTFDKVDVLGNIKSLEKLALENHDFDIFTEYTLTFNDFLIKIKELCGNWRFDDEHADGMMAKSVYGRDALAIFNKSQSMTALGAAVGFLKDKALIEGFNEIKLDIKKIRFEGDIDDSMNRLLLKLDDIRKNAPKIGNAQRLYFYYFFRELFNNEGDSYLIINEAIENAAKRYDQNA